MKGDKKRLAPAAGARMHFIDGLRGIAAFAVLLFHISNSDVFRHTTGGWTGPFHLFAGRTTGFLVFFVISGFVIAWCLRNARIDAGFTVKFILRRSLRLDLPYWAAIFLTLCVSIFFTHVLHATTYPIPAGATVAANLLYLQHIVHHPDILYVFWTLCYEVQFYTAYLLLQFLSQRATRNEKVSSFLLTTILLVTGFASLLCFLLDPSIGGWCYNWWYLFAFGALICRQMIAGRQTLTPLNAIVLVAAAFLSWQREPIAAAFTGLAIYAAIRFNGLCTWLAWSAIQYLGRISYSLYLTHAIVIQVLSSLAMHVRSAMFFHALPVYLAMLALPLIAAEIFYRLFEGPSHQLAIRFGRFTTSPREIADRLKGRDDQALGRPAVAARSL